ncbi:MAG: ABC transporter permease [Bacillota bacterium]|nr:MAG: ABC transporter permease [Bacillota bacterium]
MKGMFKRSFLGIPYALFLALFVVFPLLLIVVYAFTDKNGAFTFANFISFFSSSTSLSNLFISIGIALITTAVCLLIAYPVAYILSRFKSARSYIFVLLFIAPMWINFVLRAYALREILNLAGLLGKTNFLNVIIGMVYDFLPFMILPLYTTLIKMDKSLEEASSDLGGNGAVTFFKVTLPLSLPGIVSGAMMVFLPCMSCYVITDTFGNSKVPLIGKLIESMFGVNSNWNMGAAIALIMLVIMFVTMLFTGGFKRESTARGNAL